MRGSSTLVNLLLYADDERAPILKRAEEGGLRSNYAAFTYRLICSFLDSFFTPLRMSGDRGSTRLEVLMPALPVTLEKKGDRG